MAAEPPGAGSPPSSAGAEPPPAALGAHLRAAREEAGISLRELARRLDLTPSLLSQVERGLAQPSVGTLWAVVAELGISLDALFAGDDGTAPARRAIVQRAGERTAIELEGGVRWERLTPSPDPDVVFAFVTYAPGEDAGPAHPVARPVARHRGTEYGYLISGRLAVEVGDEAFELGPGDSIVFDSETPHRFRAVGPEPTSAVWWNLGRLG
jgi:transcriptional regulator with XRE-family HTH domain